ncbi:MAG: hypothetical protein SO373_02565 [Candidatus Borkfalkiaceae bacterium]|nr:hypothetical protein [Christensenellaceae bacterium]
MHSTKDFCGKPQKSFTSLGANKIALISNRHISGVKTIIDGKTQFKPSFSP